MNEWQKCFELRDGRPTGRWQWVNEAGEGDYYFPGHWLGPEVTAVPPEPLSGAERLQ